MKQKIAITIPQPCHKNRDEMTDVADGKFCQHCNKTVIDFTTWSDTAVHNFFTENSNGACGIFLNTQLGRPLVTSGTQNRGLYRMAMALGLTVLMAQYPAANSFARSPFIYSYNLPVTHEDDYIPVDSTVVRGHVLDADTRSPMPGMLVQLFDKDKVIRQLLTDSAGCYALGAERAGEYRLRVSEYAQNASAIAVTLQGARYYSNADKTIMLKENMVNMEDILMQGILVGSITTAGGAMPMPITTPITWSVAVKHFKHKHKSHKKKKR